ncbi:hypothetical protein H2200_002874 [Cladophialophora chaetospira]|uniref:Uncharacterized protein n=1 Tax=Cladophialophora chaetospira TaxID=386627 RepID=A0AA39CM74_9EURO|nr:hypothetical protein H2200_002874 [Cladophialophora chaetospira]
MPLPSFTKKYYHAPYPAIDPSQPALSAQGKVVLITGGGSGVGQATCLAFAKANAKAVVILGRRVNALEETKTLAQRVAKSTIVESYPLDITDESTLENCFREVSQKYGTVDICVNAAAYLSDKGTIKDSPVSEFWASFDIGVKGTYIVAQQYLRHCTRSKDPVFIAVNSFIAHLPGSMVETAPASYASSKIAVEKLVEYMAKENPDVRSYSLHPGVIETAMSKKSAEMMPEELRKNNPFLPYDDVALPACFSVWLASQQGAVIPSGKYLWSNWDVEELKRRASELREDQVSLMVTLPGWPFSLPDEEVQPDYQTAAKLGGRES